MTAYTNFEEYIAWAPALARTHLETICQTIRKLVPPGTEETISYGIPTFKLNGTYVVYFAGYAQHVSVYPIPAGDEAFEQEIKPYKSGRGTLKFALDKPLPLDLIKKVVQLHIERNAQRGKK